MDLNQSKTNSGDEDGGQGIVRRVKNDVPEFLPIILGTDNNAYGVARAIHKNYGIQSICLGKQPLQYTSHSKILTRVLDPKMGDDEVLIRHLREVAARHPGLPKIIVPCGDGYSEQLSRNKEALTAQGFLFNIVDSELQKRLENKTDFYRTCEEFGLPYPQTEIIDASCVAAGPVVLPFDFPVALKADDSIEYLDLEFEGKKKAYRITSQKELDQTLEKIYASGYTGTMVAQDFIPGDSSAMAVLNAYVSRSGQVRMMCFGQCVLDAILPAEIGNYHALYTEDGSCVYETFRKFLEAVKYTGFANFDLKLDPRDGVYKVFEVNLRQGRSSFYMPLGGCEFITYLVEDLLGIDDGTAPAHFHRDRGKMWLYVDPWVVRRYVPRSLRDRAIQVLRSGYGFTEWYRDDRTWGRWLAYRRNRLSSIKSYLKNASKPAR